MNIEQDKIALVTGATRGIGLEIALTLARGGCRVLGTGTTKEGVAQLQSKLDDIGVSHRAEILCLEDQSSIQDRVKELAQAFGPPDVLIHCAGIARDKLVMRMTDDDWHQVMDVNLNSILHLVKPCLKHMISQRWGRIIAIGSVAGQMGNQGQAQYSASKAGLEGFIKSLAREVGARSICANVVSPGFIETDMTTQFSNAQRESLEAQIPLNRFGKKSEVAGVVEFLLSEAASYITGAVIPVNGGLAMC